MVEQLSPFDQLKNDGNTKLREALAKIKKDESLQVCQVLIADAESSYKQALQVQGITPLQESSIHKNLVKVYTERERIEKSRHLKLYWFGQSLSAMDKALFFGIDCQTQQWTQEIVQRGSAFMSRLRLIMNREDAQTKAGYFESLYVSMNKENVDLAQRLAWYIAHANYKSSTSLFNGKKFKEAFRMCNVALQFFNIHAETHEHNLLRYPFMANNFKNDTQRQKFKKELYKSSQILRAEIELLRGQSFFSEAIFDAENLDMDGIFDAIDCTNNSQKIAFENNCTELEVRCEAFLGKIYFVGLRKLVKAKRHLSNTVRLEFTLRPRDCSNEPWFQLCKTQLQTITDQLAREEQQRINSELQPYLEMWAEDLRKLKAERNKGAQTFLKYILQNYVPQDKKFELTDEMLTENQIKRTITIKFSRIFHPDRNVNEERKIQVLRQEIMKHLSSFIEEYRCGGNDDD